ASSAASASGCGLRARSSRPAAGASRWTASRVREPPSPSRCEGRSSPVGARTVLIVDDDPDVRDATVDALVDEGFSAHAVGDGPAGLDYLRRHPDTPLVLLDWNMSPMNGEQFLVELRNSNGHI